MVAEHGFGAFAERADGAQRSRGGGAAVDQVAYEAQLAVGGKVTVNQLVKRVGAALEVANGEKMSMDHKMKLSDSIRCK